MTEEDDDFVSQSGVLITNAWTDGAALDSVAIPVWAEDGDGENFFLGEVQYRTPWKGYTWRCAECGCSNVAWGPGWFDTYIQAAQNLLPHFREEHL